MKVNKIILKGNERSARLNGFNKPERPAAVRAITGVMANAQKKDCFVGI